MICTHCQATIADKAIVCYRCGAPTAIPAVEKRSGPAAKRALPVTVIVLELVAVALVIVGLLAESGTTTRTMAFIGAVCAFVASAVVLIGGKGKS